MNFSLNLSGKNDQNLCPSFSRNSVTISSTASEWSLLRITSQRTSLFSTKKLARLKNFGRKTQKRNICSTFYWKTQISRRSSFFTATADTRWRLLNCLFTTGMPMEMLSCLNIWLKLRENKEMFVWRICSGDVLGIIVSIFSKESFIFSIFLWIISI